MEQRLSMLCTLGGAQAIGRSRGGLTTKLHVVVEALGNLARWRLTAGRAADVTEAEPLLEGIPAEASLPAKPTARKP